jgi:hypothetical protein
MILGHCSTLKGLKQPLVVNLIPEINGNMEIFCVIVESHVFSWVLFATPAE